MDPVTISSLLTNISSIVTAAVGWMQSAATAIAGNPVALLFILLPLMGVGIGLFKRIINSSDVCRDASI